MAGNTEKVILGAGKWYLKAYTSGEVDLATLVADANLIGYTQGGATIEYTPETYTVEDDIGMVRKTFMTKAAATMKTGLLTMGVASLVALMSMGDVTTSGSKTTLKLGGGRSALKKFAVAFQYTDPDDDSTITVGMIATNAGTLSLAFTKDKETVPEITFTAESNGVNDTIIVIEESAGEPKN